MNPTLAFAAALALVPASPKEAPRTWITPDDLRDIPSNVTLTAFDLMIDPKGRPVNCRITRASGSDALDARVCQIFLDRGRFKPASNKKIRTHGVWSSRLVWVPNAVTPFSADISPWDATVPLPAGMPNREVVVRLTGILDPDGSVTHCEIFKHSAVAILNARACQVWSTMKMRPILDAGGNPVTGIRTFTLAFYNQ